MSKKIMKRSLALGALMAFVITGSAMAAELTEGLSKNDAGKYVLNQQLDGKQADGSCKVYTLGSQEVILSTSSASYVPIENAIIELSNGQKLTIESNDGYRYNGILQNVTVNGEGHIVLDQIGNDAAIGYGTDMPNNVTINAKKIEIESKHTHAVYLSGTRPGTHILNAKEIIISSIFSAQSKKDNGAASCVYTEAGNINIVGFDNLTMTSKNESGDITEGSPAVYANIAGRVNISGDNATINNEGRGAIVALNGGNIEASLNSLYVSTKNIAGGTEVRKNSTIASQGNNSVLKLSVTNEFIVNAEDDKNAIGVSSGTLDLDIANATTQITGNIQATSGTMTGFVVNGSESFVTGTINTENNQNAPISFGEGARWNNTGESNVNNLTLNNGIVNVDKGSVTATNLTGKGIVEVSSLESENKLTSTNETSADISVQAVGDAATAIMNDETKFSEIADAYGVQNVEYKLFVEDELLGTASVMAKNGNLIDGAEVTKTANSTNVSIGEMTGLALVAWRAENNDMNKRLGELRNTNGEHGVWVRMVRGESEYSSVKNQYNNYQLGYDQKVGDWTVGGALTYTDAESNFATGNGENEHKGFAVYGSKLNADGSFIDLIAKYSKLDHDFNTSEGVGGADYDTDGYSLSAEYGKRFIQENGMWIEPQVELTYGKVDSADYVTKKGYKATQDSMESLVGRIGFSIGQNIEKGNVYARASYLYDFDGETNVAFTDGSRKAEFKNDFGGGLWEVGVGANINLSKSTYIYADIEKTFGGEVDTNWQWNLGVRYSF